MHTSSQHRLTWLQYFRQEVHKAVIKQKEEGFTLIELLLVIGIIAILAAIVILAINPTANIQSAQNNATQKQARQLQNAIVQHVISHGAPPANITTAPKVLCADDIGSPTGECEIALKTEIANSVNSDYSFISQIPRAANADANNLAPENSGFRVYTDGTRYFVNPIVTATTPLVDLTDGLVFHWDFEDGAGVTVTDQVGSNDGTISNGATWSTDVPVTAFTNSYAMQFDDDDSRVVVASSPETALADNDFTIAFWLKTPSGESSTLIDKATDFGPRYLIAVGSTNATTSTITWDGTGQVCPAFCSDGTTRTIGPASFAADTWTHVAFTADRTAEEGYVYINGTQSSVYTLAGMGNLDSFNQFIVGVYDDLGFVGFGGLVDDVRIYNKALSTAEATALANGQS